MRSVFVSVMVFPLCAIAAGVNCDLRRPPPDAAVNVNHGQFLFIYPRSIAEGYTGCQTMWDERGRKYWVVEFESGKPRAMTINEAKPAKAIKCSYRGEELTEGPRDACVDFKPLAKGIPSIPKKDEPRVPKGRDPRR